MEPRRGQLIFPLFAPLHRDHGQALRYDSNVFARKDNERNTQKNRIMIAEGQGAPAVLAGRGGGGPGWTSTGPGAHREKRRADNRPGEGASRGEKRKRTAQGTTHAANDDSEIRHEAGPPCRQATDKTPIAPSLSRRALSAAVPARLFCFLAGGGGREHERVRVFAIRQPAAREHTQDGQQAVAWSLRSHQRSRSLPDSPSGAHAPPPLSSHRPPDEGE